jgi:DNA-binding beta-propeller fold protein YncE
MEKNTVQVVDVNNDVKVAEIRVGKEPNTMAVDKNGHVWVLCEGAVWEADGEQPSLWEINPLLKTAEKRYEFDGTAMVLRANPSGDQLYVIYNNEVRRFDIATLTLSDTFRIAAEPQGMFYNMAVEPKTGDIYVTDAKNYMMNGTVYRFSYDGVKLSSFEAGVIPSAMLFK